MSDEQNKTEDDALDDAIAKLESMDDDDFEKAIQNPDNLTDDKEESNSDNEEEEENITAENQDDDSHEEDDSSDDNDTTESDDPDEVTEEDTESNESDEEIKEDDEEVKVTDEELIALADDFKLPKDDLAKLFQPINAAGSKIKLNSVDEIITLVQKGADYQNKSTALAQDRKFVKMLRDNDLLDTDRLSFLIDINKKDPAAIAKLVKDAEIDTFELDDQDDYESNDYTPDMQQVAVGDVLEGLKQTDTYDRLMSELEELDETSAKHLYEQPESIPIINKQMELGIYDEVKAEVTKRKMLGQIASNTPFIQAYFVVGKELEESNRFATQTSNQITQPKKVPANDKELEAKRNQFGSSRKPTKSSKKSKQPSIEDLDKLSDADFNKRYSAT